MLIVYHKGGKNEGVWHLFFFWQEEINFLLHTTMECPPRVTMSLLYGDSVFPHTIFLSCACCP